jgi:hypothetical protein
LLVVVHVANLLVVRGGFRRAAPRWSANFRRGARGPANFRRAAPIRKVLVLRDPEQTRTFKRGQNLEGCRTFRRRAADPPRIRRGKSSPERRWKRREERVSASNSDEQQKQTKTHTCRCFGTSAASRRHPARAPATRTLPVQYFRNELHARPRAKRKDRGSISKSFVNVLPLASRREIWHKFTRKLVNLERTEKDSFFRRTLSTKIGLGQVENGLVEDFLWLTKKAPLPKKLLP